MMRQFECSADDVLLKTVIESLLNESPAIRFDEQFVGLDVNRIPHVIKDKDPILKIFLESSLKQIPISFLDQRLTEEQDCEPRLLFVKTMIPLKDYPEWSQFLELIKILNQAFIKILNEHRHQPSLIEPIQKIFQLSKNLDKGYLFFETTFEKGLLFPGQLCVLLRLLTLRSPSQPKALHDQAFKKLRQSLSDLYVYQKVLLNAFLLKEKYSHHLKPILSIIEVLQDTYRLFYGHERVFFQTFSLCSKDGGKFFVISNFLKLIENFFQKKLQHRDWKFGALVPLSSLLQTVEQLKNFHSHLEIRIESEFQKQSLSVESWCQLYREFVVTQPLWLFFVMGILGFSLENKMRSKPSFVVGGSFFLRDWLSHFSHHNDIHQVRREMVMRGLESDSIWIDLFS